MPPFTNRCCLLQVSILLGLSELQARKNTGLRPDLRKTRLANSRQYLLYGWQISSQGLATPPAIMALWPRTALRSEPLC